MQIPWDDRCGGVGSAQGQRSVTATKVITSRHCPGRTPGPEHLSTRLSRLACARIPWRAGHAGCSAAPLPIQLLTQWVSGVGPSCISHLFPGDADAACAGPPWGSAPSNTARPLGQLAVAASATPGASGLSLCLAGGLHPPPPQTFPAGFKDTNFSNKRHWCQQTRFKTRSAPALKRDFTTLFTCPQVMGSHPRDIFLRTEQWNNHLWE